MAVGSGSPEVTRSASALSATKDRGQDKPRLRGSCSRAGQGFSARILEPMAYIHVRYAVDRGIHPEPCR